MNKKMQCPFCGRCVGIFTSNENSIAKVLKSKPKQQIGFKLTTFETKCNRCKALFYIQMGFN